MNEKYYINVKELMNLHQPRCKLPRPVLKKKTVIVDDGEWLPLISVEVDI